MTIAAGATMTACSSAPAAAPGVAASASPSPTASTAALAGAARWELFRSGWFEPLLTLALWAGGATAICAVLARLIVFAIPWQRLRPRSQRTADGAPITGWQGAAWAFTIFIGWCLVVTGVTATAWLASVVGVLAVAVGTARLSWWLGVRPRLLASVAADDGTASPGASARLVLLVRRMGATKPRGVEIPGASDITQLTEATATVTDNALVKAVLTIWQFVANVSPWRVDVHLLDTRRAVVRVDWNGRSMASELIDLDELELDDLELPDDTPLRMAAAVVAVSLARGYRDVRGLYGAKKWQSVGLVDLASLQPGGAQEELLIRAALRHDPDNTLATARSVTRTGRTANDADALEAYMAALEQLADRIAPLCGRREPFGRTLHRRAQPAWRRLRVEDAPYALLARTLVLWLMALRNRVAVDELSTATASKKPKKAPPARAPYRRPIPEHDVRVIVELIELIEAMAGNPRFDDQEFVADLQGRTAMTLHRLADSGLYPTGLADELRDTEKWFAAAMRSEVPTVAYSVATYLAMSGRPCEPQLVIALRHSRIRAWAPRDPELARIRDSAWMLLHPDLPADVWQSPPLAAHRERLAEIGITDPAVLAARSIDLSRYLWLQPEAYAYLRRAARLATHLISTTPKRWRARVPLLYARLSAAGVHDVSALRALSKRRMLTVLDDAVRGVRRGDGYVPAAEAIAELRRAWRSRR
ncbi:hypothetical protein GCM10025738_12320 [Microbacterium fluvii]